MRYEIDDIDDFIKLTSSLPYSIKSYKVTDECVIANLLFCRLELVYFGKKEDIDTLKKHGFVER